MSGSKLLRLCCLFLSLLLLVPSFSVVANAEEAEENLIDSDLLSWNDLSDINTELEPFQTLKLIESSNGFKYYRIGWDQPQNAGVLASNAIFTLPNLYVGDTYTFKFSVNAVQDIALTYANWFIGIGYIDPSTNKPIAYEDTFIVLTPDNMVGAIGSYSKLSSYKEFTLKYTHKENLGQPCIFIQGTLIQNPVSTTLSIGILADSISLTRDPSETEKKLDGILGWLQEIKDTLTGLPETIKTNLSAFFTDLSTKLTELKNNIKTNLETLGNNINGKLGDVSTDFSDYVSGLGDRVSTFFSDLKTNLTSEFTDFKNKVNTEFTNLKSNLTTNFNNLRSTLSSRFDKVDNFLTEIRDFFHNLYWDLVGGTCGSGDVHSSLFERLGDRIRGFFEDLKVKIDIKVEEIKTAIHDFFVPPEGFFEEWKANFDLMLETNLGFIYELFDVIESTFYVLQNFFVDVPEPVITFPAIQFKLSGKEIKLTDSIDVNLNDFTESDLLSDIYSMYKVLLHIIFIFALIFYAKKIWERTMAN